MLVCGNVVVDYCLLVWLWVVLCCDVWMYDWLFLLCGWIFLVFFLFLLLVWLIWVMSSVCCWWSSCRFWWYVVVVCFFFFVVLVGSWFCDFLGLCVVFVFVCGCLGGIVCWIFCFWVVCVVDWSGNSYWLVGWYVLGWIFWNYLVWWIGWMRLCWWLCCWICCLCVCLFMCI